MQIRHLKLAAALVLLAGFTLSAVSLLVRGQRAAASTKAPAEAGRGSLGVAPSAASPAAIPLDPRLAGSTRFERGGWIYVHLEGSPEKIGFQHGYLLAPEIGDAFAAIKLLDTHSTQRDWGFFRKTAHEMLWPKIDAEYQAELKGIVARAERARREHGSGRCGGAECI